MPDTKPKILIVDDDTDLLELLVIRLNAAGFKSRVAVGAHFRLTLPLRDPDQVHE